MHLSTRGRSCLIKNVVKETLEQRLSEKWNKSHKRGKNMSCSCVVNILHRWMKVLSNLQRPKYEFWIKKSFHLKKKVRQWRLKRCRKMESLHQQTIFHIVKCKIKLNWDIIKMAENCGKICKYFPKSQGDCSLQLNNIN